MAKRPFLGPSFWKVHPLIRMVSNGDRVVNGVRAGTDPSLKLTDAFGEVPLPSVAEKRPKTHKRKKLDKPEVSVETSVFVARTSAPDKRPHQLLDSGQAGYSRGDLVTASVPLSDIAALAEDASVAYVEPGERVFLPYTEVSPDRPSTPKASTRRVGRRASAVAVLVGIIDVQGFDFTHPDFLNRDGSTRFERIWDQGGDIHESPRGFDYGSEITKAHMDASLFDTTSGLPPTELVVQIVAATFSFAALIAVVISLRQVNKNLKANAIARIYSEIHEIHRVFIEYPELRPFFFHDEPIAKNHPHYLRARAIAEMFFDVFEHLHQLRAQAFKEADLNWKTYMGHMCDSSTFLCEYLRENEQLIFPSELRSFLMEKSERVVEANVRA